MFMKYGKLWVFQHPSQVAKHVPDLQSGLIAKILEWFEKDWSVSQSTTSTSRNIHKHLRKMVVLSSCNEKSVQLVWVSTRRSLTLLFSVIKKATVKPISRARFARMLTRLFYWQSKQIRTHLNYVSVWTEKLEYAPRHFVNIEYIYTLLAF